MGSSFQLQSLLNVSGDGRRSILPEHALSPIRLRRPFCDNHFGPRRRPQQLRPLARLRHQAQGLHYIFGDARRSTSVQNRLADDEFSYQVRTCRP